MRPIFFIIFFLMSFSVCTSAQEIRIKSVTMLPSDKSAVLNPYIDANGDTCALIKIKTNHIVGLEFPNKNQYVNSKSDNDGSYEISVPSIMRRLSFKHPNYLPGVIDLGEFGFRQLKSGKSYLVELEAKDPQKLGSTVIFKIDPPSAQFIFNDEKQSGKDLYEFKVEPGNYSYSVYANNYKSRNGVINIVQGETQQTTISLEPILHDVEIKCNISEAKVFVDDVDYGRVGKKMLPQGEHRIRIQAKNYNDIEEVQMISAGTKKLQYKLEKNATTLHIHPVSVQIFAETKNLYINGKKVKGWKNGDVVNLMPGKYQFQDDKGHTTKEEVYKTTKSLTLTFKRGNDTINGIRSGVSDVINVIRGKN